MPAASTDIFSGLPPICPGIRTFIRQPAASGFSSASSSLEVQCGHLVASSAISLLQKGHVTVYTGLSGPPPFPVPDYHMIINR